MSTLSQNNHVFAVAPQEEERAVGLKALHLLNALGRSVKLMVFEVDLCNLIFQCQVFYTSHHDTTPTRILLIVVLTDDFSNALRW